MEHPIEFPNYEEHIQEMFIPDDIGCMAYALDLATYEGVVEKANQILGRVKAGSMPPPDENRRWSDEKVKTFENWIDHGYQRVRTYLVQPSSQPIVRKDLLDLSEDEIDLLKKAFSGLRARDADIDDKFSFFNLAGIHWYPGPRRYIHCRHHDNEYNPWHRAYLIGFENALRSVEGCEAVTLPYWDILGKELPGWVYEEPFYRYEYPHDLLDFTGNRIARHQGDPTHRFSASEIRRRVFSRSSPIPSSISTALSAPTWEKFNGWSGSTSLHNAIIEAHDNGHGVCGRTITNPSVAAFDPLFFFFHCNWDRLWREWQLKQDGAVLQSFKGKLEEDSGWLDEEAGNILKPFNVQSFDMIDLDDWNITYDPPSESEALSEDPFVLASGNVLGSESFKIPSLETFSIRIKNIDRLKIPGSFKIDLSVNSDIIRSTMIFQPEEVDQCGNCRKNGTFSKDFLVPKSELPDGADIKVEIRRILEDGETELVPFSDIGNPSVNVRLLLNQ